MPNAVLLDTLWPRLARRIGLPRRFPARWHAAREIALPEGTARVWDSGGDGVPLLWVPDPPVVIEHYGEVARALCAGRRRVLVVELPGIAFGVPARGFRYGIADVGRSLARVLAMLDLSDVVLVGTCLGGYAARAAAAISPERVRGLVLLQTPSWDDGQAWLAARDPRGLLRRPWLGQAAFQLVAHRRVDAWFRFAVGDPAKSPALTALARDALAHGACFCLPSLFQQYLDPHQPRPAAPTVPTLVVAGAADRSHAATDWRRARDEFAATRLVMLDGVGHFPDLESPDRLADLLRTFPD